MMKPHQPKFAATHSFPRTEKSAAQPTQLALDGIILHRLDLQEAVEELIERATSEGLPQLAVLPIHLDHLRYFGRDGRWPGALKASHGVEWLNLVGGSSIRAKARQLTGTDWTLFVGGDLMGPLLDAAQSQRLHVGFLSESSEIQLAIEQKLAKERPGLQVLGWWTLTEPDLAESECSAQIAQQIAAAQVDLLIITLGTPWQGLWIAEHGESADASVILASSVTELFDSSNRISWRDDHSKRHWLFRPHFGGSSWRDVLGRLAAGLRLLSIRAAGSDSADQQDRNGATMPAPFPRTPGSFTDPEAKADVCVLTVTYNSSEYIAPLLESLRAETELLSIRVVVVDNGSTDGTLEALKNERDVVLVKSGGNLGYAGGINVAQEYAGPSSAILILNPDLRVSKGAISAMYEALNIPGAGAVVPVLLEFDGTVDPSLRREPSLSGIFGDAFFGSHYPSRPRWFSEADFDSESYRHSHFVDWATGAAMMIRPEISAFVGKWDERYFLYSEEIDYCRRIRAAGHRIWFESSAKMWHRQGGSGSSPQLTALLAVNRIRYVRRYHKRAYSSLFRAGVILREFLRAYQADHRPALKATLSERSWQQLPGPLVNADPVIVTRED